MRQLSELEKTNASFLAKLDIEFAFLLPTETGLSKSIMDAISPLRSYLLRKRVHDYSEQGQGQQYKVEIAATIASNSGIKSSTASLYRPNTKKGDPRIWFRGLKSQIKANEMLAIVARESTLYAVSLSSFNYQQREHSDPIFRTLLTEIRPSSELENTAKELLNKIQLIYQYGFIPAECCGDTAIGRTLETALGLSINSNPLPDYKGIEIKSKRGKSKTRKTLFAKVPDWDLSSLSSFKEFLAEYGYERDGLRRLNCTVNALKYNTQGLSLAIDDGPPELLLENGRKNNQKQKGLLVWSLINLQQKLAEKHKHTFWVSAETRIVNGKEEFRYNSIEYTRAPLTYQFSTLLSTGLMTVDHLIKAKGNSAHERGPLFKLNETGYKLLFPSSINFDLEQEYLITNS